MQCTMHTGRNVTYFSSDLEKKTTTHTQKTGSKHFLRYFTKIGPYGPSIYRYHHKGHWLK